MKYKIPIIPVIAYALLVAFFLPLHSFSQSWSREYIGDSECSALFPYNPEWELSYAEDSSMVWVGEVSDGDIFYGVICVEFAEGFGYDASKEELISVAESYLDYLRGEFNIVSHTGYETGFNLESEEEATGIADYWEDNEGDPWAVKTWIDPYNMAVMYIYSNPENSLTEYKDTFFDSFTFPDWE
jgi:hypothetical protein